MKQNNKFQKKLAELNQDINKYLKTAISNKNDLDSSYIKQAAALKNLYLELSKITKKNPESEPDDIGKKEFIRIASEILNELVGQEDPFNLLDAKTINSGAYTIDTTLFSSNLSTLAPKTPLAMKLLEFLNANIGKCNTVDKIKEALNLILNKFNDKKYLAKHYMLNIKTYSLKNSTDSVDLAEIVGSSLIGDFGSLKFNLKTCVAKAINDPTFGPNIEKAEKEKQEQEKQEQEKEKEEQNKKEFEITFAAWKAKQDEICSTIISHHTKTDSVCSMSKAAFFTALVDASNDWQKSQPLLAKELRVNIMSEIKDSAQVKDFVNAMARSLLFINTPEEYIYQNWQKSKKMPSFSALKTAIITSVDGTSPYNFIGEYVTWAAGVSGAVDSLNLSPSQQFETEKLLANFTPLFEKKELNFFYPIFEKKLNALDKKFPSLSEVSQTWQNMLYEGAIKSDSVRVLFKSLDLSEVQTFSSKTLETIANLDSIKAAFVDSKRPVVNTKLLLAKGKPVYLNIILNDGTILKNTISTKIEELNKIAFASPTDFSLTVSSDNGYEFHKKEFFAQSPVEHGKEGIACDFEFIIEYSKNKGSVTEGTQSSSQIGVEAGANTSKTDVNIDVTNNTWGADAPVVGYSHEDGHEVGTETTEGSFTAMNYSSTSGSSSTVTKEKGIQTGFISVKGYLYSSEYDEGGTILVEVVVDKNDITAPKSKKPLPITLEQTKETIRWKK